MLGYLCIVTSFLFLSCASTSNLADSGSNKFVDAIKNDYSIEGLFQNKSALDVSTANYLLWKMAKLAEDLLRVDGKLSRIMEDNKIAAVSDLKDIPNSTDVHIYRLTQCQAMAVSIAIANNLPLMLEILPETNKEPFYSLFCHYKIVPNTQKVGEAALNSDKENIYLEFNVDILSRVILQQSKAIVDMNENPITSDLFDLDTKRKFDQFYSNNKVIPLGDNRYASGYTNSIALDHFYLITPRSYDDKTIKSMFELGLGNRDFTYKAPLIELVF